MAELAQEMEDNIWTVRRRRDLGPCRASQRTRRAGRPWNVHHFVTEPGASAKDAAMGGGHHQAGPGQGGDEGSVCNISVGVGVGVRVGTGSGVTAEHSSLQVKLLALQEMLLQLVATTTRGTTNSWPLPRTLLMSPVQEPQPPRSLGLPTSMVVSRALRRGGQAGAGGAGAALRSPPPTLQRSL
nr:uncharacterized protein LOC105470739 isoform X1 [Macaca nemestrina]